MVYDFIQQRQYPSVLNNLSYFSLKYSVVYALEIVVYVCLDSVKRLVWVEFLPLIKPVLQRIRCSVHPLTFSAGVGLGYKVLVKYRL